MALQGFVQDARLPLQSLGFAFGVEYQEGRRAVGRADARDRRAFAFPVLSGIAATKPHLVLAQFGTQFISPRVAQVQPRTTDRNGPAEDARRQAEFLQIFCIERDARREVSAGRMSANEQPAGVATVNSQV